MNLDIDVFSLNVAYIYRAAIKTQILQEGWKLKRNTKC